MKEKEIAQEESKPYTCECGHVLKPGDRVQKDKFSQIRGVKRFTPGNALCPKCKRPIPFNCV